MLVRIDDPDDPRVAAYTAIRERDLAGHVALAGHGNRSIAEGEVVLRVLLTRSRFAVESLLLAERRVKLLESLPVRAPVYVAAQSVMDRITGFHIHRGVLAVGRRGPEARPEALLRDVGARALVLGLVGISNHDNVGGIFRNAAAFGADAVLLDRGCCDPLYRKAIRVSVGASLVVPFARVDSPDAMLACLSEAGFEAAGLSPRGAAPIAGFSRPARVALLLGAEGPGLPAEILNRVRTLRIPMAAGFDSLNVATASGIALYELAGREPGPA
jgi:tRNA G18 (ribose-2'-O)-methylase SpoU